MIQLLYALHLISDRFYIKQLKNCKYRIINIKGFKKDEFIIQIFSSFFRCWYNIYHTCKRVNRILRKEGNFCKTYRLERQSKVVLKAFSILLFKYKLDKDTTSIVSEGKIGDLGFIESL